MGLVDVLVVKQVVLKEGRSVCNEIFLTHFLLIFIGGVCLKHFSHCIFTWMSSFSSGIVVDVEDLVGMTLEVLEDR